MTTNVTQPPVKPVSAVTSSMRTSGKSHLSVVHDVAEAGAVRDSANAQWPLLSAAAREWSRHRPSFNAGRWDDPNSLARLSPEERTDLSATQIRHFGASDTIPGVEEEKNLAYQKSGYRDLVDTVRNRAPNTHETGVPNAGSGIAEFGESIEIRNIQPGNDNRLEFAALASRFGLSIGDRFVLQPVELGSATGFALVKTDAEDDDRLPIATLKSKHRMAFNIPGRAAIEVAWELPYESCEFTVIGEGVSFAVALLPRTALPQLFNQQIGMK